MGWFSKLIGVPELPEPSEPQTAVARVEAKPIDISNNSQTHAQLVERAKGRIERLEAKLERQQEKGIEQEYVDETLRELAWWKRQLEFSSAEVGGN